MKGLKFPENKLFCVRRPYPWTIYNPPAAASTTKSELCRHWIIFVLFSLSRLLKKSNPDPVKNNHHHANRQKRYRGGKKSKEQQNKDRGRQLKRCEANKPK